MSAVTFERPEEVRVYMHNRNINEEEKQILIENDRFTKCPYIVPYEEPEVIGGSFQKGTE